MDKIGGLRKWRLAIAVAPIISSIDDMVEKNHSLLESAGYMSKDKMIDIDKLYDSLKTVASKGPVTEHLPLIGDVKFSEDDVSKLYRYIV